MQNESTTGPQPSPCDCCVPCVPCAFFHRMMDEIPELPSDPAEYAEALTTLLANPETRAGLTRVLDDCDGMKESCVATALLMLPHLGSGDSRTLTMVLSRETRDELRGMVSLADQPDA